MVTGMVFPAYAAHVDRETMEPGQPVTLPQTSSTVTPSSHSGILYQNGNNPIFGLTFIDNALVADDFVLSGGDIFEVTDAHFIWHSQDGSSSNIEPLEYFILADDGGQPGAGVQHIIDSGTAQNVQTMALGGEDFETWFDFENLVTLDPGVTYWFALTYMPATFAVEPPAPIVFRSDVVTGSLPWATTSLPPGNVWSQSSVSDMWFQLTGDIIIVDEFCDIFPDDPKCKVGGEFLPIDSTSLLVAGAQTFSWMIPVVLSILGIGLFVVSRKSA